MDQAICKEFRDQVVTGDAWVVDTSVNRPTKGESRGFWVRSNQRSITGYMKPRRYVAGRYRAAYEKIAADLAFDAKINVPPTILYKRDDAPLTPKREEQFVCVSLVDDAETYEWSDYFPPESSDLQVTKCRNATHALLKNTFVNCGGCTAIPFDALVDNDDRHNNDNTLLVFREARIEHFLGFSKCAQFRKQMGE